MLVLAHAGHWLAQLLYAAPVGVVVGWLLLSGRRDRRSGRDRRRLEDA